MGRNLQDGAPTSMNKSGTVGTVDTELARAVPQTFTAEEFDNYRVEADAYVDKHNIVLAALRIAANVMRPGMLEESARACDMEEEHGVRGAAIRADLIRSDPT